MKRYRRIKRIQLDIISLSLFQITILSIWNVLGTLSLFTWHSKRDWRVMAFARLDSALANYLSLKLYPDSIMKNLPIFGSDHALILRDVFMSTSNGYSSRFKFEVKWLLQNDFYDLIKDVWSNFIKGCYAYQFIRKPKLLNHSIKKWKNEKNTNLDKSCFLMLKELEDIQKNLMINPTDNYLWMQEKALRSRQSYALERETYRAQRFQQNWIQSRDKKY